MLEHMGVRPPDDLDSARVSVIDLRDALAQFDPPLRTQFVRKYRMQYDMRIDREHLLLEVAEILEPVHTWTISLEGRDLGEAAPESEISNASRRAIAKARALLGLPGPLRVAGYLEMVRSWAP
jgi:hypothetical protein